MQAATSHPFSRSMRTTSNANWPAGQQIAGSTAMSGQLQIEGDLRLVARLSAVLGQPPI